MGFQPYGSFAGADALRNKFQDLYVDTLWLSRELLLMDKGVIRSVSYVAGSAGFKLNYDGTAYFNDVTLYGSFATGAYTGLGDPYIVISSADRNVISMYNDLAIEVAPTIFTHTLTGVSPGPYSAGALIRSGILDATNDGYAQLWLTGEGSSGVAIPGAQLTAGTSLGSGGASSVLSLIPTQGSLIHYNSGEANEVRVSADLIELLAGDAVVGSWAPAGLNVVGTLTGVPWTDWVPGNVLAWAVGNGTLVGRYHQVGKRVTAEIHLTLGSTSAIGAGSSTSYPVTPIAYHTARITTIHGNALFWDASTSTSYPGFMMAQGAAGRNRWFYIDASSHIVPISATAPFTWTTSDVMSCQFTYEAA